MTDNTRRNRIDRIARALFEHGTVQKAAAALGMSEVTVWRWTQKPEFQEAYREVRREALSRSSGRLLQASSAAVSAILKVMVDPNVSDAVRLRAAHFVLEHAEKTVEWAEHRLDRPELSEAVRKTGEERELLPQWLRDRWSKRTGLPFNTEKQAKRSCRLMNLAAGNCGPAAFDRISKADQEKVEAIRHRMKRADG